MRAGFLVAVCPGLTATAMMGGGNGAPSEAGVARVQQFSQGSMPSRIATPEEVAAVMAFLASTAVRGKIDPTLEVPGSPWDPPLQRAWLMISASRCREASFINGAILPVDGGWSAA